MIVWLIAARGIIRNSYSRKLLMIKFYIQGTLNKPITSYFLRNEWSLKRVLGGKKERLELYFNGEFPLNYISMEGDISISLLFW